MAVKGLKDTIYRCHAEQPPGLLKMNYGNKVCNEYMEKKMFIYAIYALPDATLKLFIHIYYVLRSYFNA